MGLVGWSLHVITLHLFDDSQIHMDGLPDLMHAWPPCGGWWAKWRVFHPGHEYLVTLSTGVMHVTNANSWNHQLPFLFYICYMYQHRKLCKIWFSDNLELEISSMKLHNHLNLYPCNASKMIRNTWTNWLKCTSPWNFCHICYGEREVKMFHTLKKFIIACLRHQTAVKKYGFISNVFSFLIIN